MFLELDNISVHYGSFAAVQNFDLALEEGTFCCLLGPSGCGKSSLLRCIGGFAPQSSGTIHLAGEVLGQEAEERPISTVFQSYGLFPNMNVGENITYGLKLRKVKKSERQGQLNAMLTRLGLDGYASKRVQELSGGEQQRVALARSLIIQPKLLLLDEPLSNLDAKLRISLRAELKRVQEDFGITTILVTHDQAEAFELGEKIVIMNKGRKVEEGTAAELYDQATDEFTREFLGESSYDPDRDEIIRPEDWLVLPDGEGERGMPARVVRRLFQGAFIFYDCELLNQEQMVRALVLNRPSEYLPQEGDLVYLVRA